MVAIVSAVWGADGAGYIHATYLSFRIGGFIGSLVTNSFMSKSFQNVYNENKTDSMRPTSSTTQDDLIETIRKIPNRTDTPIFPTILDEDKSCLLIAFSITCTLTFNCVDTVHMHD